MTSKAPVCSEMPFCLQHNKVKDKVAKEPQGLPNGFGNQAPSRGCLSSTAAPIHHLPPIPEGSFHSASIRSYYHEQESKITQFCFSFCFSSFYIFVWTEWSSSDQEMKRTKGQLEQEKLLTTQMDMVTQSKPER